MIRIRLGSLALSVSSSEPASPATVEVVYSRMERLYTTRAKHCVLACWNMMIPYLCPQLPERQKEALRYLVKVPLVYTNVAVSNRQPFLTLGVSRIHCPGSFHSSVRLNPVTDIGSYRAPRSPDAPILVQMVRTPCRPGLPERDQHRAGRAELLATGFATFEERIRDQLGRMLGPGASTRRATSRRSRSIAGRTVMPTSTTRYSTRIGGRGRHRTRLAAPVSGRSRSPIPIPLPQPTRTQRSTRPTGPCRSCLRGSFAPTP